MDINSIGIYLQKLNRLELLRVGVVYLILSKSGKAIWNKYKKNNSKNPHEGCPLYPDFKLIVKLAVEKAIKIFDIKKYETIKRQMN